MSIATPTELRSQLRLLFLLPFAPDLRGTHGGARATAAMIETLSDRHKVSVIYFAPAGAAAVPPSPRVKQFIRISAPPLLGARQSIWARALSAARMLVGGEPDWVRTTWSADMAERAVQAAADLQPDVVHFEFHVMAQYLPLIEGAAPEAALVITEHEPGIIAADEHGSRRKGVRQRLSSFVRQRAWARFERNILSRADAVITFSERDREVIRRLLGRSSVRVECIPLRLPLSSDWQPGDMQGVASDLLFVGNFRHPPNVDAAHRLIARIFPRVRQAIPSATLHLVGPDLPGELKATAGTGIVITGAVPDVAPHLRGASVVLAPLHEGGGMRVKILEACVAGKAIIGTSTAVEGLSLRDGVEFVAAETDDDFAAAAIQLLQHRERQEALGRAARAWAERTQDADEWAAEYDRLYSSLIGRRAPPLPTHDEV